MVNRNSLENINFKASIICYLFGHRFKTQRKISVLVEEKRCVFCKKQVSYNWLGEASKLTLENKKFHDELLLFISKKYIK